MQAAITPSASVWRRPRTVVIGAGHWHFPLYEAGLLRSAEVVGVAADSLDTAQPIAQRFGSTAWADWRAMLDETADVELVYVLGRHVDMPRVAEDLIARRVPFVLEKPGATNLQSLREMEAAALAAEVPVATAMVQRFGPVPALLAEIGDPLSLSFSFVAGPENRYSDSGNAWLLDPQLSGGGSLALLGVHFADMFLYASGSDASVIRARSVASATKSELAVDNHAFALLESPNGCAASIEVGWLYPDSPRKRHIGYLFCGTLGTVNVRSDGAVTIERPDGSVEERRVEVDADLLYPGFVDAVSVGLADGFRGLPGLTELRSAMEVISSAYADGAPKPADRLWQESGGVL